MFPCTKCGACCRKIGLAVQGAKNIAVLLPNWDEVANFPYEINEDNSCSKLINNQCSVYEERPLICNIDKMAAYFHLTKEDFYEMNVTACHELMIEEEIYERFKIV